MAEMNPAIRRLGEEALAALSDLPDSKPLDVLKQRLGEAIISLVQMRDALIQARRGGGAIDDRLARTNGIISAIFGTEFPVGGLATKRIEEARTALTELLRS